MSIDTNESKARADRWEAMLPPALFAAAAAEGKGETEGEGENDDASPSPSTAPTLEPAALEGELALARTMSKAISLASELETLASDWVTAASEGRLHGIADELKEAAAAHSHANMQVAPLLLEATAVLRGVLLVVADARSPLSPSKAAQVGAQAAETASRVEAAVDTLVRMVQEEGCLPPHVCADATAALDDAIRDMKGGVKRILTGIEAAGDTGGADGDGGDGGDGGADPTDLLAAASVSVPLETSRFMVNFIVTSHPRHLTVV